MECKVQTPGLRGWWAGCFNRNIVECKEIFDDYVIGPVNSFNRNIVECKDWFAALTFSKKQ